MFMLLTLVQILADFITMHRVHFVMFDIRDLYLMLCNKLNVTSTLSMQVA